MTVALYRGWRTQASGLIVVTRDDWSEFVPTLMAPELQRAMDGVIEKWGPLCRLEASKRWLDWRWIAAMIYRESGGDPKAFRREPNGWTGVGLLQITHPSLKGHHTDAELFDPELNVAIGARYIADQRKTYGDNFPRVSAAFNAGSAHLPSDEAHANAWNLHCSKGHIDAEVQALNYAVSKDLAPSSFPKAAPLLDLTEVAREADDAARSETPLTWEKGKPVA
jgi:hypothetical protein